MKVISILALFLALTACVAAVPISPSREIGHVSQAPVRATDDFTRALNAFRAEAGLGSVRQSAVLTRSAQAHADDMRARGYFSHRSPNGPNGATMMARMAASGCDLRFAAENIAMGQRSEAEVLADWAASPGHRRNMLSARMTDYGLGRAGDIWVLNLASGC
ncbi:CAP domain-containing protein [Yoonia litorea]|uniref:Cysteine-rich secretory protein family protein n=1 Tax=Yoonia litorea TaxID=1123755 RepID=A0A1I6LI57_9RHOB|nr:CAP domain-containing protein [Yoonia litorea]SFS02988.1 Cysteine-rich secretory protein family protein [Yoonia litorea]